MDDDGLHDIDDIFICGFPESGVPWLQHLVCTFLKNFTPRIHTSHGLPSSFPPNILSGRCRMILVVRDPRDVVVAMFHTWCLQGTGSMEHWDSFLQSFLQGNLDSEWWFDYISEWTETLKRSEHIPYVIHYEAARKNLPHTIHNLASYLGVTQADPNGSPDISPLGEYGSSGDSSSHPNGPARKKRRTEPPPTHMLTNATDLGEVGLWKTWFTVAQCECFDSLLQKKLGGSPLVTPYMT